MAKLRTHLDDLLVVLRAAAGLHPLPDTAPQLRDLLAGRLSSSDADLADRVRGLDDWHAEVLSDLVADAHALAATLAAPPGDGAGETKVG
jgi:hypothetical protein